MEYVAEERHEQQRSDQTAFDEQRDVVRVRPPVRLAGDELVVDGEVVVAETEERMQVQHVRDERVDAEVRRRSTTARLDARTDHRLEVVETPVQLEEHRKRDEDER